jgi:hypothetical protein
VAAILEDPDRERPRSADHSRQVVRQVPDEFLRRPRRRRFQGSWCTVNDPMPVQTHTQVEEPGDCRPCRKETATRFRLQGQQPKHSSNASASR